MLQNPNTPQSGNSTGLVMGGINLAATRVEVIPPEIRLSGEELERLKARQKAGSLVEIHVEPAEPGNHSRTRKTR